MRLVLIGIFFLTSLYSKAQFPLDFFINKNDGAVVVYHAEHISEPSKHDSLSRPTSISYDVNPITIEISPCKATHELFLCQSDSVSFRLKFYFDKTNKCTKIMIESNSVDCTNAYFENFIIHTDKYKWKNSTDGKKISSVPFREEDINGKTIIYYLEVTFEEGEIRLEEKNLPKSEWKKLKKISRKQK